MGGGEVLEVFGPEHVEAGGTDLGDVVGRCDGDTGDNRGGAAVKDVAVEGSGGVEGEGEAIAADILGRVAHAVELGEDDGPGGLSDAEEEGGLRPPLARLAVPTARRVAAEPGSWTTSVISQGAGEAGDAAGGGVEHGPHHGAAVGGEAGEAAEDGGGGGGLGVPGDDVAAVNEGLGGDGERPAGEVGPTPSISRMGQVMLPAPSMTMDQVPKGRASATSPATT